jgi:uncharacterized protein YuzE
MNFSYDKLVDALYIRFKKKRIVESDQVAEGVIIDYDSKGQIVGLEVLDASKRFPAEISNKFNSKKLPVIFELLKN